MQNSLRGLIVAHFGSQMRAAEFLELHPVTISMWMTRYPGRFYKMVPKLVDHGIDLQTLMDAIKQREDAIKNRTHV